jgi:hypothetical protein
MPVIDVVSLIENSLNGNLILSKELLTRTILSNKHTDFSADMTKTFSAIKWKPRISLAMGIEKMINYKIIQEVILLKINKYNKQQSQHLNHK